MLLRKGSLLHLSKDVDVVVELEDIYQNMDLIFAGNALERLPQSSDLRNLVKVILMLNDPLANILSVIMNSEKIGKPECDVKPVSKLGNEVLKVMKDHGYIGEFKKIEDGKGGYVKINLLGMINKCNVIKPRYNVKYVDYEKFEKRYLPAKDIGIIFVSTTKGILTHIQAKEKKLGGRLLGFCY